MADFSVQPEWLCQQNAVSLKVELWKFFQTFRSSLYVYISLHNQFILAERGRVSPRSFGISSVQRDGALRQLHGSAAICTKRRRRGTRAAGRNQIPTTWSAAAVIVKNLKWIRVLSNKPDGIKNRHGNLVPSHVSSPKTTTTIIMRIIIILIHIHTQPNLLY